MGRQEGGVVLAVAGFVFLVGAFRGTWRQTIDALVGKGGTTSGGGVATNVTASPPASGSSTSSPPTGLPGTSTIPRHALSTSG